MVPEGGWNNINRSEGVINTKHTIAFDAKTSVRHVDANGYMHVDVSNITKEQVAPYYGKEIPGYEELGLTGNEIYQMYRPAKELQKAVKTFNGIPLAFEHHEMNAESMPKQFIIGSLGTNAEYKAPYIVNSLIVTDKEAIEAIERGEYKELSAAYRYTPVMNSGVFDGQHYDGKMTDIMANHVALVREGRAGADVVVADANTIKRATKITKGVKHMKKRISSVVRRAMAFDAVPEIESTDINAGALQNAMTAVEAEREGIKPKKLGLDVDDGADIEAIIEKFFPEGSDEDKDTVRRLLTKLKGGSETEDEDIEEEDDEFDDEEAEDADDDNDDYEIEVVEAGGGNEEAEDEDEMELEDEDEEDEEQAEDEDEDEDEEQDYSHAMIKLGLDADDPTSSKAFSEGVKYAKGLTAKMPKKKPAQIEEDEEEAVDPVKKELPNKKAMFKEQLEKAKDDAIKQTRAHIKSLQDATRECAKLAGQLDPFAFDSANDIYKKTLELNGINPKKYPRSAYRGMVAVLNAKRENVLAHDSAFKSVFGIKEKSVESALKGLKNIERL